MTSAIIVLILSITPIFFPHKLLDKNNSPEVSQKELKQLRKGGIIAFCLGLGLIFLELYQRGL